MTDWTAIGTIDDIPRLGARTVETPLGQVAVFRTAEDDIFALINKCPHRGGPLSDGIVSVFFSPTLAKILATLLVAMVLVFRPQGLFGTRAA